MLNACLMLLATLPVGPGLDHERLLRAFATVESSNRNPAPYRDNTQMSWGRFAFGKARWTECGGKSSDWGKAPIAEQDRIMRVAIRRYAARATRRGHTGEAAFNYVARLHNGNPGPRPNGYTRKLRAAYGR